MSSRPQLGIGLATAILLFQPQFAPAQPISIQTATLGQSQKTAEISTEELRRILSDGSATVFDARPFMEFAAGHIPGALNVSAKPSVPMSLYVSDVAEIERLLHGEKSGAIVLYCNGPFCGKSGRLADELIQSGFTNVRRYQLGAPVWRALGESCRSSQKASAMSGRAIIPPGYTMLARPPTIVPGRFREPPICRRMR